MKEIKVPMLTTVSGTFNINLGNLEPLNPSKTRTITIGTIESNENDWEIIRKNGAQVIYGVVHIESKIEKILALYFFGNNKENLDKKQFFINEVLEAESLTFFQKKQLLQKMLDKTNILKGKNKDYLQTNLKKIMDLRNAFAHGTLIENKQRGWTIQYYSGGIKAIELSDDYWEGVEDCFKKINSLLKNISQELTS